MQKGEFFVEKGGKKLAEKKGETKKRRKKKCVALGTRTRDGKSWRSGKIMTSLGWMLEDFSRFSLVQCRRIESTTTSENRWNMIPS